MGDIVVQRGISDIGVAGGSSSAFTAVDSLASTFEVNTCNQYSHSGDIASGANLEADDMSGALELTAVDTLSFSRVSGSKGASMRFAWELWSYTGAPGGVNEFIVRSRNTVSMATAADGTASLDTTPTNIDRCIPFITGVSSTVTVNGEDHLTCTAYINDAGTLVVERGGGDGAGTTTVQVVVVEFTGSNWSVGHGRATGQTGDTGNITLNTDSDGVGGSTFDVSDWSTAFITGYLQITNNAEGLAHQAIRWLEGPSTTQVSWAYDGGHNATSDYMVHVLKHPDMTVTRYNTTGSAVTQNIDITSASLTDLAAAAVRGYAQTSGTGDALGRGWRNFRLTSLTNVESWCHRTGNTMQHQTQVIDLSGIVSAGGTTYDEDISGAVDLAESLGSSALISGSTSEAVELTAQYGSAAGLLVEFNAQLDVSHDLADVRAAVADISEQLALEHGFTGLLAMFGVLAEQIIITDALNARLVVTVSADSATDFQHVWAENVGFVEFLQASNALTADTTAYMVFRNDIEGQVEPGEQVTPATAGAINAQIGASVSFGDTLLISAAMVESTIETIDLDDSATPGGIVSAALASNADLQHSIGMQAAITGSFSSDIAVSELLEVSAAVLARSVNLVELSDEQSPVYRGICSTEAASTLAAAFLAVSGEVERIVEVLAESRRRAMIAPTRKRNISTKLN